MLKRLKSQPKRTIMFLQSVLVCLVLLMGALLDGCKSSPADPLTQLRSARVACAEIPQTFDPRAARALSDASFLNCFFEGLMRVDAEGQLVAGAAESVSVSKDGLVYTFTLRETNWSNGQPVTSYDFAYSWKTVLDPAFAAPNAFQLYPIKNACPINCGILAIGALGVHTPDDKTLVVTLEKPTPYFLELTSLFTLFPVNQRDLNACNGPFQVASHLLKNEVVARRNPHYWGKETVKLDEVRFVFLDERTALALMEAGELDFVGSPLSVLPADAIGALRERVRAVDAIGTHWLQFQVENVPSLAMRKALTFAINRRALIDYVVHGNQLPATGLIPSGSLWQAHSYFNDNDVEAACQALAAVGAIPPLRLTYAQSERNHRIAQVLQEQWRTILRLHVSLEALEPQTAMQKIKNGDYQMALGSWFADIRDPINFLAIFERKHNGTNNTRWESTKYQELLAQSDLTESPSERLELLQRAEAVLMGDLPVAPIFYYRLNYLQNPRLKGVVVSELGIISLREAYFEP